MKKLGHGTPEHRLHGPLGFSEQDRRNAILLAAREHVRYYGYHKTTVGDIARESHLPTPYLYQSFRSKQAIGDAVCTMALMDLTSELAAGLRQVVPIKDCITFIFNYLHAHSRRLSVDDPKIHDLIALAFQQSWEARHAYDVALFEIVRGAVLRGRKTGEFERKTPLNETCEAIRCTAVAFFHPVLVAQAHASLAIDAIIVADLVYRSLIP